MDFNRMSLWKSTQLVNKDESPQRRLTSCKSAEEFFQVKGNKKKYALNFKNERPMKNSCLLKPYDLKTNNIEEDDFKFRHIDALTATNTEHSLGQKVIKFKKRIPKVKLNKCQKQQELSKSKSGMINLSISPKKLNPPKVIKKPKVIQNLIGKKLNDFHILKKIGQGAFSQVFMAIDKKIGFLCSLKKISKKQITQNNKIVTLVREIKIHLYLKHKNIVDLYGVFQDGDSVYLILEYCPNGDLFRYIQKRRRISEDIQIHEAATFIRQISRAIQFMHNNYVMHRDIKPDNIFLSIGNVIKLGDFGCSVGYSNFELRNTQCGTPLYLAPELVGKGEYLQSVDIWAIGVLTYELVSGYSPFSIVTTQDLLKVIQKQIDFDYIDNDLAKSFVMKLLEKDVALRYQIEDIIDHPFLQYSQQEQIQQIKF